MAAIIGLLNVAGQADWLARNIGQPTAERWMALAESIMSWALPSINDDGDDVDGIELKYC